MSAAATGQAFAGAPTPAAGVAVVIPARNAHATLPDAIESVLRQTRPPEEILVVDDRSEDGTAAAAAEFGTGVRVLEGRGIGPAAARNVAVRAASSPFIAFLDADDTWLPDAVENLLGAFARCPDAGLAYGDVLVERGRSSASFLAGKRFATEGFVYDRLLRECFILTSAVMVPRSALEEAGLFDESPDLRFGAEDWDLWLRIARRRRVAAVTRPVARRRESGSNLTADALRVAESRVHVLRAHAALDAAGSVAPAGLIASELGRWLLGLGYQRFIRGEIEGARQAMAEGSRLVRPTGRQRALRWVAGLPGPLPETVRALWAMRKRWGPGARP